MRKEQINSPFGMKPLPCKNRNSGFRCFESIFVLMKKENVMAILFR
jgi:hypothetical protein